MQWPESLHHLIHYPLLTSLTSCPELSLNPLHYRHSGLCDDSLASTFSHVLSSLLGKHCLTQALTSFIHLLKTHLLIQSFKITLSNFTVSPLPHVQISHFCIVISLWHLPLSNIFCMFPFYLIFSLPH